MNQDPAQLFALLERRLGLMRELAAALEQGQEAIAAMDLARIQQGTARQADLCCELKSLEDQLHAEHQRLSPEFHLPAAAGAAHPGPLLSGEMAQRRAILLRESQALQARVRYLNRVHAALLQRARHSLGVLRNVLASSAVTYAPPPPAEPASLGPGAAK